MAEDTKQPGPEEPKTPDASAPDTSGADPSSSQASSADAEKAAIVEQAKSRVAAAKEGLSGDATAGTPKPPVKKKDEGPKPTDASSHPLVKKLKDKFGASIGEASEFIGQLSINVVGEQIVAICNFLKDDEKEAFDYLSDMTCVHYPERKAAPFDLVYNLYSISANERVRLKVQSSEEGVESVTSVWPAANWLEREVFDLFGVRFSNHPDLRRLLLPPDWEGYPLRKDYPLEFIENAWTEKHLPVQDAVQVEQTQQRRAYGLEILSVPEERMMREIFRGGKEVMSKDK